MDTRPPPVVTVTDPSRPGRPAEVLVVAEEPGPRDPAVRRRQRRTAGVVLVLAGLVAAGAEVRDRRADEVAERQLAGIVSLSSGVRGSATSVDPDGRARIAVTLRLWNGGPRPVTVLGATLGDLTSAEEVGVARGGRGDLVLSMSADCPDERPPWSPEDSVLALRVRTGAGVQPYELWEPQDAGREVFLQACGWGPLPEYAHLGAPGVTDAAGSLTLEAEAATRAPVRLLALHADEGSGVTLAVPELAAGPLLLPRWSPGGSPARSLQAQVGVSDCGAARTAVLAGGARVTGVFEDVNGERAQVDLALDAPVLERRLAALCS